MVLFSILTRCLGSTGGFQLDQARTNITDLNSIKPSLVYMYYTHSGYRTSIFGKNHAYYRISMVNANVTMPY